MRTVRQVAVALHLVMVLLLAAAAPARAQSGQQVTPDQKHTLISRDVGEERWAIAENEADGTLTGNVFFRDGRPPQFVSCKPTSIIPNPDPALARYTYDCFGTDTCTTEGCPPWMFIASVTVSGLFFEPPSGEPSPTPTSGGTPATTGTPKATATRAGATPTPKPAATPTPKSSSTPRTTPTPAPQPSSATTPTPGGTPSPGATPTPKVTAEPAATATPKPAPLVVTPDKATLSIGDSTLFVLTGGVPPYNLYVTSGGSVDPTTVLTAGSPFTFTAEGSGTSTIIIVDAATALKTVAVTVK